MRNAALCLGLLTPLAPLGQASAAQALRFVKHKSDGSRVKALVSFLSKDVLKQVPQLNSSAGVKEVTASLHRQNQLAAELSKTYQALPVIQEATGFTEKHEIYYAPANDLGAVRGIVKASVMEPGQGHLGGRQLVEVTTNGAQYLTILFPQNNAFFHKFTSNTPVILSDDRTLRDVWALPAGELQRYSENVFSASKDITSYAKTRSLRSPEWRDWQKLPAVQNAKLTQGELLGTIEYFTGVTDNY